jgi:hypothetical protein
MNVRVEEEPLRPGVQANVDFAGQTVTIQLADGTYTEGLVASGTPIGATVQGPLIINGNLSNPAAVVIDVVGQSSIAAQAGASLTVQGLTVISTQSGGSAGYGLAAVYGASIFFRSINFGACSDAHCYAAGNGLIAAFDNYEINGQSQFHGLGEPGGDFQMSSQGSPAIVVTLVGTPNFSGAFVAASGGSVVAPVNTFVGGSTGPRYLAVLNGVIDTQGRGPNYFPGSVAGSTQTGGQYA